MGKARKRIPQKTQMDVLIRSSMTCCICRNSARNVQIHHVDGDPANNGRSNLAVVCTNCHDRIQKTGGVTKDFSPELVMRFKNDWEAIVANRTNEIREPLAANQASDISELLSKVQSGSVPLSQCIAEALALAQKTQNPSLERFCRNELTGWDADYLRKHPDEKHAYRTIEVFVSLHKINMRYFGWTSASDILDHIMSDRENFFPRKTIVAHPVFALESDASLAHKNTLMTMTFPFGDIFPDSKHPDIPLFAYAAWTTHKHLLESIRTELTSRLLELLPEARQR